MSVEGDLHLIHQVFVPACPGHVTIVVSAAHLVRLASSALDAENESVSNILKEAKSLLWCPPQRFW
jgi:hypothetical protein